MSLPNGTTAVFTIGEVAAAGGDAYAQYTGGLKSSQDYAFYYAAIASGVSAVAGNGRLGPFINGLGYGIAPAAAVTQLGINIGNLQNAQTPRDSFIASLGILSGAMATMAALAPPSPLKAALVAASVSAAALQQLAQNYETVDDFQQDIQDAFDDLNEALHNNALQDWISENQFLDPVFELPSQLSSYFDEAGRFLGNLRDPLALDLNHDGYISTIFTDEGITFDHGATGVEYGTGWINSGDAWPALDLNGNGVIDSGRELFGDNTIKLDGNRATDAFDALMSFDSNGDGKVDAADASGDVDLDGIMEAGETFWDINRNGVFDADDKTFVDLRLWKAANSDGIAGSYDTAQFNLTENRFFREFDSSPTVSPTAAALPNMKGSGVVRDLREAA